MHGTPAIATVDGASFLRNPLLHQEVFGPFSIIVRCRDMEEMLQVATQMEGQLTGTVMGTLDDVRNHSEMISVIQGFCGRFILNSVPTGVEVCLSMHHGGPFPASTDSRFTSVGADGIKRFARPIAWQNWPNELLPDELKNDNPLSMMRTVNNEPSTDIIEG
jgi:NADP-dependent aldehyde dehydrogenase